MLLALIKLKLRITTNAFDTEIQHLIDAALDNMHTLNINTEKQEPIVIAAIGLFVKAHFGDNPNADRYLQEFERMITKLSIDSENA